MFSPRRPSLTAHDLESAGLFPSSRPSASDEVRIEIPGLKHPVWAVLPPPNTPRKSPRYAHPRSQPVPTPESRRSSLVAPTGIPSGPGAPPTASTVSTALGGGQTERAAASEQQSEPSPLVAARRRESISEVANRWGISFSDAVEICDAVEGLQSPTTEPTTPPPPPPRPHRRLHFASQLPPLTPLNETGSWCDAPQAGDLVPLPPTPLSAGRPRRRSSLTVASPFYVFEISTPDCGPGRLSFSRPCVPEPHDLEEGRGVKAEPMADCRISIPDLGTIVSMLSTTAIV